MALNYSFHSSEEGHLYRLGTGTDKNNFLFELVLFVITYCRRPDR